MGSARYIGRIGALAVALGIGTAVASTPGVALGDPESRETASVDSNTPSDDTTDVDTADSSATNKDSSGPNDEDEDDVEDPDDGPSLDLGEDFEAETIEAEPKHDYEVEADEPEALSELPRPRDGGADADPPPRFALVTSAEPDEPTGASVAAVAEREEATPPAAEEPVETASVLVESSINPAPQPVTVVPPPQPATRNIVSGLLALVGLGPAASGNTPVAPTQSPAAVVALAYVRRELQQAVTQHALTAGVATVETSQTTNALGGVLGGLLHLLFNNPPTTAYDPAQNTQGGAGVITGTLHAADPDGDALTFTVTEAPQHGTVVVNAPDGTFTYTPDPAFAHAGGTDSFTIEVADNHPSLLSPAGVVSVDVSVTVSAVNAPPQVVGAPTVGTPDPVTGIVSGTVSFADPDGDDLAYAVIGDPDGVVTIDPDTGAWTYTPSPRARLLASDINATPDDREATFTVVASDGIASADVSVVVPVVPLARSTIQVGAGPGGFAFSPDGRYAYVTNTGDNTVSVIDTTTDTVVATVSDIGHTSLGVAVSPDGSRVYVSNLETEGTVTAIDTATNTPVGDPIPVGAFPAGLVVSADNTKVYVTNVDDGTVSVIDVATHAVVKTIPVGGSAFDIVLAPDGTTAYAVSTWAGPVAVIDTATDTVTTTIELDGVPGGIAVSPDGKVLYVSDGANDGVWMIDTATNTVIGDPIAVGPSPFSMAVSPDGGLLYVINTADETMSVIDTSTRTVVATLEAQVGRVAVHPDGTRIYFTGTTVTVFTLGPAPAPAVV